MAGWEPQERGCRSAQSRAISTPPPPNLSGRAPPSALQVGAVVTSVAVEVPCAAPPRPTPSPHARTCQSQHKEDPRRCWWPDKLTD